jgi:hypothetical protein
VVGAERPESVRRWTPARPGPKRTPAIKTRTLKVGKRATRTRPAALAAVLKQHPGDFRGMTVNPKRGTVRVT